METIILRMIQIQISHLWSRSKKHDPELVIRQAWYVPMRNWAEGARSKPLRFTAKALDSVPATLVGFLKMEDN
jgi:hypothetical protein